MSELYAKNTAAIKQALESHEKRMVDLENQILTLTGHVQTAINMVNQLQQTNTLALQQLYGTGGTANGDDG